MAARMAGVDGQTGGIAATVDLNGVERMSKDGRERPGPFPRGPDGDVARRPEGTGARVLQAGIRADDIRLAAFPIGARHLRTEES
jgi:hypothetical protein